MPLSRLPPMKREIDSIQLPPAAIAGHSGDRYVPPAAAGPAIHSRKVSAAAEAKARARASTCSTSRPARSNQGMSPTHVDLARIPRPRRDPCRTGTDDPPPQQIYHSFHHPTTSSRRLLDTLCRALSQLEVAWNSAGRLPHELWGRRGSPGVGQQPADVTNSQALSPMSRRGDRDTARQVADSTSRSGCVHVPSQESTHARAHDPRDSIPSPTPRAGHRTEMGSARRARHLVAPPIICSLTFPLSSIQH